MVDADSKNNFEIDLGEVLAVIRAGWHVALAVVILILIATAVYAMLQPRLFEATLTVRAPDNMAIAELSFPGVFGVDLINYQQCEPASATVIKSRTSTNLVVSGSDIPCVVPSYVHESFLKGLKSIEVRNHVVQQDGVKTSFKDDQGLMLISVRAEDLETASRVRDEIASSAHRQTQEYWEQAFRFRVNETISELEKSRATIIAEEKQGKKELIDQLTMSLQVLTTDKRMGLDGPARERPVPDVVVRIMSAQGVELELRNREAIERYLKRVLSAEEGNATIEGDAKLIDRQIHELETQRNKTIQIASHEVVNSSQSNRIVEPSYIRILLPGIVLALILGLFSGSLWGVFRAYR
jgi:hypothetical protein